ncbi:alpha/beta fold hydrolase [Aerosakkonemataceae cyanobacterium BLCC-F154]|uniref:Alpha/beta fold hydrolase n=1 Tax=Floridaenema fluviatile BLCC-F154 TaxID=3153640 RepID=A0ABV4YGP3_9CYAN
MSSLPNALWLNVSPALQQFDRPLLIHLSHHVAIAQWEYCQTPDEPMSLEVAIDLLDDYLKNQNRPVDLIGHSTSGLLGLLYARQHPEKVRSLTLLSVGPYPAVDWQAHYYAQLQKLPCSREVLLNQMVNNLFGHQSPGIIREILQILEQDLMTSLSPHTLFRRVSFSPSKVSVPMLVCGSADDIIVDPYTLEGWQSWLKSGDRIWQCPKGRYFFHYFHPQKVCEQIVDFWDLPPLSQDRTASLANFKVSL